MSLPNETAGNGKQCEGEDHAIGRRSSPSATFPVVWTYLDPLRPLADAFRRPQFKPTVILLSSTLLMVAWRYLGSMEFYLDHLDPRGLLFGEPVATAAVYSFASCFLLLGVVPALVVKLVLRERLAEYGVQFGIPTRTVRSFLLGAPLFILGGYLASRSTAVLLEYPINPIADRSPALFAFHIFTYLLFYIGWEFHFRGYLQMGLRESVGSANALLVQVLASSLLHIGKPGVEVFAAILAGILWGLLVYRTRSLLSGFLQHFLLGASLDYFIVYH